MFFYDFRSTVFVTFITGIGIKVTSRVAKVTAVVGTFMIGWKCMIDCCGFPPVCGVAYRALSGKMIGRAIGHMAGLAIGRVDR